MGVSMGVWVGVFILILLSEHVYYFDASSFSLSLSLLHTHYRGWKLALSTLPAMQNPGVRSLTAYKNRIIRYRSFLYLSMQF